MNFEEGYYKQRDPGYYWVRIGDQWQINYYAFNRRGDYWGWCSHKPTSHETAIWLDAVFDEIDEDRITREK